MNHPLRYGRYFGVIAWVCLSLICASKAFLMADQDTADQIVRSRIPRETQKFAEKLESGSISVEQNCLGFRQFSGGAKYTFNGTASFKKNGQFFLYMWLREPPKQGDPKGSGLSLCYGMNNQYCFEMRRNKAGNAWVVSKVVTVTPDFDDSKAGFVLREGFRSLVNKSISDLTAIALEAPNLQPNQERVPAEKLFDLPAFQLSSVARDDAKPNVLRVNFTYDAIHSQTKKPCRSYCILEFDLDMHCLPTKLHQTYKTESTEVVHDWRREWVKTGDNSYAVKESIDSKEASHSEVMHSVKGNYEMKINLGVVPESDFTLSAFGFPEPPGVEWKKPFPWYLVLAGIGTACLGVFFFLRSRARRQSGVA